MSNIYDRFDEDIRKNLHKSINQLMKKRLNEGLTLDDLSKSINMDKSNILLKLAESNELKFTFKDAVQFMYVLDGALVLQIVAAEDIEHFKNGSSISNKIKKLFKKGVD